MDPNFEWFKNGQKLGKMFVDWRFIKSRFVHDPTVQDEIYDMFKHLRIKLKRGEIGKENMHLIRAEMQLIEDRINEAVNHG
jgi:hypothetical protein